MRKTWAMTKAHRLWCCSRWGKNLLEGRRQNEGTLGPGAFLAFLSSAWVLIFHQLPVWVGYSLCGRIRCWLERKSCQSMAPISALWTCDFTVIWRVFWLKHIRKRGGHVDFWWLPLAVLCLLMCIKLCHAHQWAAVRSHSFCGRKQHRGEPRE